MENHLCEVSLQAKQIQKEAVETNSGSMAVTLTRLQLPWYFLYGNWWELCQNPIQKYNTTDEYDLGLSINIPHRQLNFFQQYETKEKANGLNMIQN